MEYNLNFLEVCKALSENRCMAIKSEGGCTYRKHKDREVLVLDYCPSVGIMVTAQEFLGKWKLIGIKPVKHKKVIKDVEWFHSDAEGFTFILPRCISFDWRKLAGKPLMKMTLEWEE